MLCSQEVKNNDAESEAQKEAKPILVRTAKSKSDIVRICLEFRCLQSENSVICEYCYAGTGIPGKFSYDFSLGEDFYDTPAPRPFLNLK